MGKGGKRNGAPSLAKVSGEAEEWRREDFAQAQHASQAVGGRTGLYARKAMRATHGAIKFGHDRDYRSFVLFFFKNCSGVMAYRYGFSIAGIVQKADTS